MKIILMLFGACTATVSLAQTTDTTTNTLTSVEVKAYGQVRRLKDVPAAVGYVNSQTLNHFGAASIVQAVNTVAGVRMEERSPGSYRFNIRGSSLRSPFGIRNVKVYFNDVPFTDPGGHTYLNGLGYYNFGSIEILKGPGSSLYGAGTGGVLLIEGMAANEEPSVFGEYAVGSFGLQNAYAAVSTGSVDSKNRIGFQHQESDGYRRHSALKRDVLSWNGQFRMGEKQLLKTTFLYSNLFYETPGALTEAEFELNPKLARPGGSGFPGSEASGAAIYQKTFLAGISFSQQLAASFTNQSSAYGMFTELRNPTIRNYGKATEPHVGGRTVFTYRKSLLPAELTFNFGGELQQNFTTSTVYKNKSSQPDSLQTEDEIRIRQSFVFVQANVSMQSWELTAGASLNGSGLRFRRAFPTPAPEQSRTLNNELTPRVALAKKFTNLTLYTSLSRGFSPPTSAELLPSGSAINLSLEPENGINYDLGARGTFGKGLTFDVNAFYFRLRNTIVQRRDAGGGDYFINAGKTAQKGIETSLNYALFRPGFFLTQVSAWLNHTYHHFRYKDFKQVTLDYSGKALPGVAPNTLSSGVDITTRNGLLATVTYYFSSAIPLNDANSEMAGAYHLVGTKVGYEKWFRNKQRVKLIVGADNLLNQKYSLGNDINGFGGRFYNAAACRNYFASVVLHVFTQHDGR